MSTLTKLYYSFRGTPSGTVYSDKPAKILEIETQDDPRLGHQALPSMISPQTSTKLVCGYSTSISRMLATLPGLFYTSPDAV